MDEVPMLGPINPADVVSLAMRAEKRGQLTYKPLLIHEFTLSRDQVGYFGGKR